MEQVFFGKGSRGEGRTGKGQDNHICSSFSSALGKGLGFVVFVFTVSEANKRL